MSIYGLGLGSAPAPNAPNGEHLLIAQKLHAESSLKSGAGWFIWIAGLSVVNSISAYSGSRWGFAAGLGITQLVDAIARQLGAAGLFLGLAINVMAVAFFVLLWVFGRKAQKWPFITGLVFYGLDSLLIVAIGLWFGLIIHALGLMGMVSGLKASSELKQLAEAQQTAVAGATVAAG
jgi:uncharacterized membrane protein